MALRKLGVFAVLLALLVGGGLTAIAASPLSGSWEMGIAFTPSSPTFVGLIQTDSDTYSRLTVDYTIGGWKLESITLFEMSGLTNQQFSAAGAWWIVDVNSKLTFSPVLGSAASSISKAKTTNAVTHDYDLGKQYFVNSVTATVTVDAPGTEWYIRVSQDGSSWSTVSSKFTGDGSSGTVVVDRLARYVQIYTAGSYVDESSVDIEVSGQAWQTKARMVAGGLTLDSTFTIASAASTCSLSATGASPEGGLSANVTVYFDMGNSGCSTAFDRATGYINFSFGCLDNVKAAWKLNCTEGFDEVSFTTTDIDVGLSFITFDAKITFSMLEKTVTLTPKLDLGTITCFTIYTSLVNDTSAGALSIEGIQIYGIGMKHSWNGVSFESLSYLDNLHHVKDTYWEKFTIKSVGDSCCGGSLTFETSTYFAATHTTLFDWAETDIEVSVGLSTNFTSSIGVVVKSTGITDLAFGVEYTW